MLAPASPRRIAVPLAAICLGLGAGGGCAGEPLVFTCKSSEQCTSGGRAGTCEPTGSCSFADATCGSGRRYGALSAATRANQCTECGNHQLDPGEECDDGNQASNDACLPTCRWNVCGDGFARDFVEECDDGNQASGDGCSQNCLRCAAGDARFTWPENGHCYSRSNAPETWDGAQKACSSSGAHLVSYNSEVEQIAVRAAILGGALTDPSWIGLHDSDGKATYGWVTSEPVVAPMRDFSPPSSPGLCAANLGRAGGWNYLPCAATHSYLCEQPGWAIEPKHHHAYRAFFNGPAWAQARDICPKWGGHLATIEDADEQQFLTAQFFGTFWLGAQKTVPTSPPSFAWITGEPFVFQAFADGEPDDGAVGTCLALGGDRRWHDRVCDGSWKGPYGFICEVE